MSLSELARALRRHRTTVRQWVSAGAPVVERADDSDDSSWRFDLAAVVRWLEKQSAAKERARAAKIIERLKAAPVDGGDAISIEEAKRRRAVVELELAGLELEERRGELVAVDEVKATNARVDSAVRRQLLAVPTKVAPLLDGGLSVQEREAVVREHVHDALQELCDAEPSE